MRARLTTALTVLGALTVLLLAGNTVALAATGQGLLLGKSNSANNITALTRTTSGSALKLQTTSSTAAPLTVNGAGKVANLNADKVDGLDSTTLQTKTYVYTAAISTPTSSLTLAIPLPSGKYVISYSAYLSGAQNSYIDCYLEQDPTSGNSLYVAEVSFNTGTSIPGANGTGYLVKAPTNAVELNCFSDNPFTTFSNEPIQILATKVDTAVVGTIADPALATSRVAARKN